jgi:hypothetical protein
MNGTCTKLHYFNTETGFLSYEVDRYPQGPHGERKIADAVCLTPDGRCMCVIGRTYVGLMMRTYKCVGLGRGKCWAIWPSRADGGRFGDAVLPSGYPDEVLLTELCMSPCGSKVMLMYKHQGTVNRERCTITVIDLEKAFASRLRACTSMAVSRMVCPQRISWASDGIYVHAKEGGVLRLGLVQ